MEVTITIKLADGSTKIIELQNVNINTTWGTAPVALAQESGIVANLTLQGQIKNPVPDTFAPV